VKYFIETYGCQMNVHDSERMAGVARDVRLRPRRVGCGRPTWWSSTPAAVASAPNTSSTRVLGEIKEMGRELGRDPIVAVAGCVAQQEGDQLIARSAGVVDIVVGTQQVKLLPMLANDALSERSAGFDGRWRSETHRDRQSVRRALVPAWRRPPRRSGPRLRHDHRRL
jgi:tRNA-2-methylthio-N6-dimethylallyladenosine synthase